MDIMHMDLTPVISAIFWGIVITFAVRHHYKKHKNQSEEPDKFNENINKKFNENLNAARRHKETGYDEMMRGAGRLSDSDKIEIRELIGRNELPEALRRIQKLTGLGLADCKKIADNPDMYF